MYIYYIMSSTTQRIRRCNVLYWEFGKHGKASTTHDWPIAGLGITIVRVVSIDLQKIDWLFFQTTADSAGRDSLEFEILVEHYENLLTCFLCSLEVYAIMKIRVFSELEFVLDLTSHWLTINTSSHQSHRLSCMILDMKHTVLTKKSRFYIRFEVITPYEL